MYQIVAIENGSRHVTYSARAKYKVINQLTYYRSYFKTHGRGIGFYKRGKELGVYLKPSGNRIYRIEKGE